MSGRYPFSGIPSGWYVVATSNELKPGEVVGRRYFDRDLVLYRTESGRAVLSDAACPHMGAHLARGRVEGELLRCPFHGFCFDGDGSCVSTPYGQGPPRAARLRTWQLEERNGLVLAWWDANDKPPEWGVPELDLTGFNDLIFRLYEVESHPQETTENSIDYGHFTSVHNFVHAEMTREVETQGAHLQSGYAIEASLKSVGLPFGSIRIEFDVDVWGLGYSLVQAEVESLGLQGRLFVLPTPVDGEHLHLRLACNTKHRSALLGRIMRRLFHRGFCAEVEEDIPVWRTKQYLERPALAAGDGPLAEYRRWASQFYPPATGDEPTGADGSASR